MSGGGHADLQKRMSLLRECHADVNSRRVASRRSVFSVGAVASVRTVSAGGRIIRVDGTHGAACAAKPILAAHAACSLVAGEIGDESDIIANGNIEFGAQVRLAGDGYGDMADFAETGSRIFRKLQ